MRIFNCNVPTEEGFYPAIEIVGFTITWDSRRKGASLSFSPLQLPWHGTKRIVHPRHRGRRKLAESETWTMSIILFLFYFI
jgi:hypothetical protein